MTRSIAVITTGDPPPPALFARPELAARLTAIDIYALKRQSLASFSALFIAAGSDQRELLEQKPALTRYLHAGGVLVCNGHVVDPYVDGLTPFRPLPAFDVEQLTVHRLRSHPVHDGIDMRDLTFRHGVAGFYGRGCNPPPDGAVPVTGLGPARLPVDWEWSPPGGGRLFMHAGNDLWGCGDSGARCLPVQLVAWALSASAIGRPA
ncbi:hypothetical protein DAI18_16140 [Microvirgula aerodenitrificans]|uniref:ThuA-like domain-containing protein n=1 Tax=Microvirgula aerodenitrificans TaxID=57480 RepID=A0A2S0PDK1_9NEIS|nr:hypothetical protein [Microvirgula aerodenitrificans]AVY95403.1 hypothetical protein DAI18_16140 [Microvirgula aerodenitrificans]